MTVTSIPKSIYGIIGFPLEHSLSPVMHNTAFKELGVDAEYKLFPLKEEELGDFFSGLHESDSPIFGLNVTVPYKETVLPYLDSLSPFALKVNAVNTIVIAPGRKLVGYNTDGPGFLAHLTELGFQTQGKRIAILGAGGTTRAIVAVLCLLPERPARITIYNRTREKLDELLEDLKKRIDIRIVAAVDSVDDLNIELADLLINTTSLGMKSGDPSPVAEEMLHKGLLVYDVIYNPSETKLLKLAKKNGAAVSNGLGMLFYQGVLAFQHWSEMLLDSHTRLKMKESLEKAMR